MAISLGIYTIFRQTHLELQKKQHQNAVSEGVAAVMLLVFRHTHIHIYNISNPPNGEFLSRSPATVRVFAGV